TIVVYPRGNKKVQNDLTDDVSIYVKCVDAPKSGCCAQVVFAISNINDPLVNLPMSGK
ncbi:hypothetical protein PQX77_002068, partial [Marasmius sp. AFHP31]